MSAGLRLSAIAVSIVGCVLPSFEKAEPTGGSGAGPQGGGGAGGEATCETTPIAAKPATAAPGGEIDFFTAVRTIDLGETHLGSRPGFDLDGTCTCCQGCKQTFTCQAPTGGDTEVCDEVEGLANAGIDNNSAKFFDAFDAGFPNIITSEDLTKKAGLGTWSVLVRVFHYNGEADDQVVSVALYGTLGSEAPPEWTGADIWHVRDDSLTPDYVSIEDAVVLRDDAYVAGNLLIAKFAATPIVLRLDHNLVVTLHDAVLQAEIDKTPAGAYRLLNGRIGGTWRQIDVFAAMGAMQNLDMPVVCTLTPGYDMYMKGPLCRQADSGVAEVCDSLSFGAGFTADPIDSSVPIDTDMSLFVPCDFSGEPSADGC